MSNISNRIIPENYLGQRIDKVLSELYPDYSRSKLSQFLKDGVITINNKKYAPDEKVCGLEEITFNSIPTQPTTSLHAEDIPLDIIFEDEQVLVINKPIGLIVHPGAGNPEHTLVNALLHHDDTLYNLPRAGIIHRLDKDTTGLLIIAKTLKAHTMLVNQMQSRLIKREYIALVYGHIIAGNIINTHFGRDHKNRVKMAVLNSGKEAITKYKVAKHYQFATLLNLELLTGRTHQIRVHMEHIHHPIVGDKLYKSHIRMGKGVPQDIRQLLINFPRQALHAEKLSFTHPQTLEEINCQAKLPDDLQNLLNILDDDYAYRTS